MRHFGSGRPLSALGARVGGALLASAALVLSACTAHPFAAVTHAGVPRAAEVALVRFTSCGDALRNLRAAASYAVGHGLEAVNAGAVPLAGGDAAAGAGSRGPASAVPGAAAPAGAPAVAGQAGAGQTAAGQTGGSTTPGALGAYSGTNTAEAGVDEPDLVKTDGRRIVTVTGSVLRVVDAQTKQLTGVLDLSAGSGFSGATPAKLLLDSDHALVLFDQGYPVMGRPAPSGPPQVSPPDIGGPAQAGRAQAGSAQAGSGAAVSRSANAGAGTATPGRKASATAVPVPIIGPRLLLIDLSSGTPRITSEYTIDGALVDARQVGSVARVVVHSAPRILFPPALGGSTQARAADQAVIEQAPVRSWLPRYALTVGAAARTGQVDCAATSHPAAATYSGTSMLTVLTFDLSSDTLGDGAPVTVVADGDTVYSNGSSLYIANDRQWSVPPAGVLPPAGTAPGAAPTAAGEPAPVSAPATPPATAPPVTPQQYTGLYKFDISGQGRPVYEASGVVPGWLLGSSGLAQYALSEWNGALRVATTTDGAFSSWDGQPSQSAVYVLQQVGDMLVTIGKVGGLGQGEQIYAVRFAGPAGYVVTFRQTDPLYTLDLSDPAQPRVAGELLLSGYSAYLDPIDATHLIGVGQDADARGQTQGTQISLFDVSDLAAPVRLAVYHLQFGHSEAELDPHAFLYWPASRLLVIPVQLPSTFQPGPVPQGADVPLAPVSEAVVLHVGDHTITRVGTITHLAVPGFAGGLIRRSLVTGDALWTLSDVGLKANELTTLVPLGWVPFE